MSLNIHNHRDGFATICPHCIAQFDNMEWFKSRISTHSSAKADFMCLLSNCPKCGESSWAHWGKWMIKAYDEMTV